MSTAATAEEGAFDSSPSGTADDPLDLDHEPPEGFPVRFPPLMMP